MALESRWGSDPNDSHGLKEEMDGLMKGMWHMFQHHSGHPVGSRRFVTWRTAKGFLKDSRGDLADQHWVRGGGGRLDVAEPGKGSAERQCGVWGESCSLHLLEL